MSKKRQVITIVMTVDVPDVALCEDVATAAHLAATRGSFALALRERLGSVLLDREATLYSSVDVGFVETRVTVEKCGLRGGAGADGTSQRIRNLLSDGTARTAVEIAVALGVPSPKVAALIAGMAKRGVLVRKRRNRGGSFAYRLAEAV